MFSKLTSILFQDKYPLRRLTGGLLGKKTRLGERLKIKIKIHDYHILFHPAGLCSQYWYNPQIRSNDYHFIKNYLKEGDTYIDIGANIGTTVIPAAKAVGKSGKVVAFEPHPQTCAYLKENIQLNQLSNVDVRNCAVGNTRGSVYFTDRSTDDTNQVSSTSENNIEVSSIILDDVGLTLGKISLLKLDVEGYEKFVIEGGTKTLQTVDCLYFEASDHNFRDFGYQSKDILMALEQLGFSLFQEARRKRTYTN
jgi:FkbM family methyltransferase